MALYELSDEIVKGILVLLDRVDLKGGEALSFVTITTALKNPVQQEAKKDPIEKVDK